MPTILVADDEPDIRTLIAFRLGTRWLSNIAGGGRTPCPKNGGRAEARSDSDGHHDAKTWMAFDALKALKEGEATRGIPVIVLTAKSDYPSVLQGWNLEAENYITKTVRHGRIGADCRRDPALPQNFRILRNLTI